MDDTHNIAKINFHHKIEKESLVPQGMDSKGGFTKSCAEVTFVCVFPLHWVEQAQGFYGIQFYTVNDFCCQNAKVLHSLAFQKIQQIHSVLCVLSPEMLVLYWVASAHLQSTSFFLKYRSFSKY